MGLRLFFLPHFSGATFIPDSIVASDQPGRTNLVSITYGPPGHGIYHIQIILFQLEMIHQSQSQKDIN